MARFFHSSMPKKDSKAHGGEVGGCIEVGPDPDHPDMLPRPLMFGGGAVPLKKGGLAFSLVGHGWWHIGPGEYVDLPDSVSTKIVKNMAPQLLTKEEAIAQGIAYEDGSLIAAHRAPAPAPSAEPARVALDELAAEAPPVEAPRRGRPPKQQ